MEDDIMDLLFVSDDGTTWAYDTNGDGEIDTAVAITIDDDHTAVTTVMDTDHNGVFDTFLSEIDNNNDSIMDSLLVGHDYDQDGNIESIKYFMDTDGDGNYNAVAQFHSDDDPNILYRVEIDLDVNGDHISDYHEEDIIPADVQEGYLPFAFNSLGSAAPDGRFDPNTPDELVAGTPADDMEVWECQGPTNRCALYSQKFAIEQITGQDIDIEEFANIAKENGWFSEENGTQGLNMNKMLEYYGVDHDVTYDSNISDLEEALRNGDKVIVSIDSGQVWYGEANDIFSPMTVSDHAVQVIGIDYSDPDAPMVVLNDSGSPMGCGEMVPLDTFENAWSAGDHQMIVCHA